MTTHCHSRSHPRCEPEQVPVWETPMWWFASETAWRELGWPARYYTRTPECWPVWEAAA